MSLPLRDQQVIWHPYTQMQLTGPPIAIVKGEGAYVFDDKGKKYIDAISSWWVNIHGHAHPYIAKKISDQLSKLEHVIFAGFTHEPAVELAERLLQILPSNQSKIFYSDNGSTAVEVAIKMAIQHWHNKGQKRSTIIALEHAYHGDTFGSMSVSARSAFTNPFSDFLFEVVRIPFPAKGEEERTIDKLKSEIKKHGSETAAFIFEPLVLGAGGMLIYDASALNELMRICKEHDVLSIADEVMTGFGRTGKYFACDHLHEQPDIICLSKGLTGGTMPMGVTSCSQDIYNAFLSDDRGKTFFHGHSYTANPIGCSAALASLDLLLEENCLKNIQRISQSHQAFLKKQLDNGITTKIRSTGTILAIDVETNEPTTYFNSLRDQLYAFFIERGIIMRPLGNTVYTMPPYCISDEDLSFIYSAIEEVQRRFVFTEAS